MQRGTFSLIIDYASICSKQKHVLNIYPTFLYIYIYIYRPLMFLFKQSQKASLTSPILSCFLQYSTNIVLTMKKSVIIGQQK